MPLTVESTLRDRLMRVSQVLDKQVFFIVGCQKSGTTWIEKLLNGHPAIRCHGEAYFAPILKQTLNQAVATYNQHHKAGDIANFDKQDIRLLFAFACGINFARWVGDADVIAVGEKTPEHALCMKELVQCFPSAKFIHIIRDGRDVCVSGYFHNQRKGGAKFQQQFLDLDHYIQYTVTQHWQSYITQARSFGQEFAPQYHELKYEDLHTDPQGQIQAMLDFLGVSSGDAEIAACAEAGTFRTLAAGRKRGEEDTRSFFRKGVVGDWRNHFDASNTDTFNRFGGELLQELGYDL